MDVHFHSVVGDNLDRVVEVLRVAAARASVVILTGGLGPTPDDLTREAVSVGLDRPLRRDPLLATRVRSFFEAMGRDMPEDNLKQAELPQGGVAIEPEGTAPGFYVEDGSVTVVALPGVPWEMKAMLAKTVLPLLRAGAGSGAIVSSEVLVVGLGESAAHQRIDDIVASQTNPTIAFLAGSGRVRVRVTAKAPTRDAALALICPVESRIRGRLGDAAVPSEGGSLARALGAMLAARGATVAAAESLTGGLIGAELTSVPGASAYFLGSLVCYSTEAKKTVAGIDPTILEEPGAVSEEAACALAQAAASVFGADLGIAATGVAGPSDQYGHPPGTIYVGAALGGAAEGRKVRGYGDRDNVRAFAVTAALDLGRRVLSMG